jgi:hypothetical protein
MVYAEVRADLGQRPSVGVLERSFLDLLVGQTLAADGDAGFFEELDNTVPANTEDSSEGCR